MVVTNVGKAATNESRLWPNPPYLVVTYIYMPKAAVAKPVMASTAFEKGSE